MPGKRVVQLGYGMQGKASLVDLLASPGIEEIVVTDCYPGFEKDEGTFICLGNELYSWGTECRERQAWWICWRLRGS